MTSRIVQQVSTGLRPLSFSPDGSRTVILESNASPWKGLPFEVHQSIPGELAAAGPARGELGLLIFLEGAVDIASSVAGRESRHRMTPGTTLFMSGDSPTSSRVEGSAVLAAVPILPEWLHRVEVEHSPAMFERATPIVADQNIRELVNLMRREVETDAAVGGLYAESLSLALLTYVLDRVPSLGLHTHGRLSEAQCRRLKKVIREGVGEDLTITKLAALAGVGPRHFSRIFRQAFGMSPHQYVLHQRLAEGARCLAAGGRDIAEIALSLGFSSQSHFASAFRRRFGQTPRQYALTARGRRLTDF